jgi:hypothetical protein
MKLVLVFIITLCPHGVAIFLVCSVMEVLYRGLIQFGIIEGGLEFLSLGFGVVTFVVLFCHRLFIYFLKRKKTLK